MVNFINTELTDIINIVNVQQHYGSKVVIQDLNLLIEDKPNRGQFVVILGHSGCGKSTVLRYVAGLQRPTSGQVFLKNVEQTGQLKVSMVFQKYSSFPWLTVWDNVALGLKFMSIPESELVKKVQDIIDLVGLTGQENKYAQYPALSGGQLQRVAIARSLITTPEIILLDEPCSGLDVKTKSQIQDLLRKLYHQYQPTILMVTHDVSEAVYLADEIWVMNSNPGFIKERIVVDLPLDRTQQIKHSDQFIKLVRQVEDVLK